MTKTDFMGNEYTIGDTVVYPSMSGRSITMTSATVLKFLPSGAVSLQPHAGARWKRSGHSYYIDSRTGEKLINVYRNEDLYAKEPAHYVHRETGERAHFPFETTVPWATREHYAYVPPVWHDWVKLAEDPPKPVVVKNTENIIFIKKGNGA